jgi:hypothetical protein
MVTEIYLEDVSVLKSLGLYVMEDVRMQPFNTFEDLVYEGQHL